jgi:DNA-binding protein HU-beta
MASKSNVIPLFHSARKLATPQGTTNNTPSTNMANKAELLELVQKNLGADATKRSASDALEAVLEAISKAVKKDGVVQLIGFGTFKVAKRAARTGRNPKTGEALKIKASKSVRFVASSALKKVL